MYLAYCEMPALRQASKKAKTAVRPQTTGVDYWLGIGFCVILTYTNLRTNDMGVCQNWGYLIAYANNHRVRIFLDGRTGTCPKP